MKNKILFPDDYFPFSDRCFHYLLLAETVTIRLSVIQPNGD